MAVLTTESLARRLLQTASADVAATEPAALRDEPDGLHQHRTRIRRLRAVLAAVGRFADGADTQPLRASLREWGAQLGEVRDAEVRAQQAEAAFAAHGLDDPDARRRLVDDERAGHARLHARLVELNDTPRAREREQLLRTSGLELRVADPDDPAAETFARMLRREARRLRRAAEHADGALENYHDVRKAARRLRYVAEAVNEAEPKLLGEAARRLAAAGEKVHGVLGHHRDQTLFVERLEHARGRASHAGESTAPYDALIDAARADADRRLAKLPKALRRVKKAARALP